MMRHYIGNEGETGRQWTSSNFDDRTAHELYVWPFQDAVHAGVVSTMCAYNGLNGTYSCADPVSLGKWLHENSTFKGGCCRTLGVYTKTQKSTQPMPVLTRSSEPLPQLSAGKAPDYLVSRIPGYWAWEITIY